MASLRLSKGRLQQNINFLMLNTLSRFESPSPLQKTTNTSKKTAFNSPGDLMLLHFKCLIINIPVTPRPDILETLSDTSHHQHAWDWLVSITGGYLEEEINHKTN